MALTGDGGDEVLSGYTSYVTEKLTGRFRALPAVARRSLQLSTALAGKVVRGRLEYQLNGAERFLRLAERSFGARMIAKMSTLGPESIRKLIPTAFGTIRIEDFFAGVFGECPFTDAFYKQMYFHLKVSLPDDMLAKVDRMSMSHSLETRVPFLDHRLVELTYQVHKDVKMPGVRRKDLLRRTIGRRLPASLLKAPKMPFSVPFREWFKQDDFNERLRTWSRQDFGLNGARFGRSLKPTGREGRLRRFHLAAVRPQTLDGWAAGPLRDLICRECRGDLSRKTNSNAIDLGYCKCKRAANIDLYVYIPAAGKARAAPRNARYANHEGSFRFTIVVVDNDACESARSVVETCMLRLKVPERIPRGIPSEHRCGPEHLRCAGKRRTRCLHR